MSAICWKKTSINGSAFLVLSILIACVSVSSSAQPIEDDHTIDYDLTMAMFCAGWNEGLFRISIEPAYVKAGFHMVNAPGYRKIAEFWITWVERKTFVPRDDIEKAFSRESNQVQTLVRQIAEMPKDERRAGRSAVVKPLRKCAQFQQSLKE